MSQFGDYVFMGFVGLVVGALFLLTLPITLPAYAIGRWVVAPLVDIFLPEA